jgi:molybdate transport system substrate-binding protein
MRTSPRVKFWTFLATWLLMLLGCNHGSDLQKPGEPVVIFAAASTKDAVQEIADKFKSEQKGEVKINADDSSKLATQIVEDAPAHIFLSANEKWADFVQHKGFALESAPLMGNSLVIVTPKGNPAGIRSPADLTMPPLKRLAIAGPTVPAGIYARQALQKLNVWDELEAAKKIVAGDNVRVTLTYVERGECEAGIVYATDARITDKVELVYTFPAETHDPIRYVLVLLKSDNQPSLARVFFDYLQSPKAMEVFAKYGFSRLEKK